MLRAVAGGGTVTIDATTIIGGATTQVLFNLSGMVSSSANLTFDGTDLTIANKLRAGTTGGYLNFSNTAGAGPSITAGTAASAVSAQTITQTHNYNTTAINTMLQTVTATSSHANSTHATYKTGSTTIFEVGLTSTSSSPALRLAGDTASGWYSGAGNQWWFSASTPTFRVVQASMNMTSNGQYGFENGSSNTLGGSIDVNINRGGAGILQIGTTTTNAAGTLSVAKVQSGAASDLVLAYNTTTKVTVGTSTVTLADSITTGAPSGGTAAAWKLGVAAVVSPTSPNRTIELDVGGTIYYLAAKTTNN